MLPDDTHYQYYGASVAVPLSVRTTAKLLGGTVIVGLHDWDYVKGSPSQWTVYIKKSHAKLYFTPKGRLKKC